MDELAPDNGAAAVMIGLAVVVPTKVDGRPLSRDSLATNGPETGQRTLGNRSWLGLRPVLNGVKVGQVEKDSTNNPASYCS